MAPFLRRWQLQWLRNVRKDSPKAWGYLRQFSHIVPHPMPEVIGAPLGDSTFDDLGEREKGIPFFSFVTMPDLASEATARRVLCHLHS